MSRKSLQVQGYTPEEIKAMFKTEPKYSIGVRLYAVYQVSMGQPTRNLQELYNTSFKQICNWVHRFENDGIEGLYDKHKSGRPPRLSKSQLEKIKEMILTSTPVEFGYNSSTWNGPLLIDYIEKEFDVIYKKAQIYNIMKYLGLTYQKGRPSYPEANK
jgi:transposase